MSRRNLIQPLHAVRIPASHSRHKDDGYLRDSLRIYDGVHNLQIQFRFSVREGVELALLNHCTVNGITNWLSSIWYIRGEILEKDVHVCFIIGSVGFK